MKKDYSAEVGRFCIDSREGENTPLFSEADLRIPLVKDTLIGRAENEDEESLSFNKPNYDGRKIIIPQTELNRHISRNHGKLSIVNNKDVRYTHISESGMNTFLWVPDKGLVRNMTSSGFFGLEFDEGNKLSDDRYLLIGGRSLKKNVNLCDASLREIFPYGSYYVKIN